VEGRSTSTSVVAGRFRSVDFSSVTDPRVLSGASWPWSSKEGSSACLALRFGGDGDADGADACFLVGESRIDASVKRVATRSIRFDSASSTSPRLPRRTVGDKFGELDTDSSASLDLFFFGDPSGSLSMFIALRLRGLFEGDDCTLEACENGRWRWGVDVLLRVGIGIPALSVLRGE